MWKTYARSLGISFEESKVEFTDVQFYNDNQSLSNLRELSLYLSVQPGKGNFEVLRLINDSETLVAKGTIQLIEKPITPVKTEIETINETSKAEFYSELLHSGHYYDHALQVVSKLSFGNNSKSKTNH